MKLIEARYYLLQVQLHMDLNLAQYKLEYSLTTVEFPNCFPTLRLYL